MIDIGQVRRTAEAPSPHPEVLGAEGVVVTRAFLRQVASELTAARVPPMCPGSGTTAPHR